MTTTAPAAPAPHLQHVVGFHRDERGRIHVACSEGDFRITLDPKAGQARARRYGDEHRAIVKRVAELQARS